MTVEELKALSRCVEPLTASGVVADHHERAAAYNDLHARFRERLTLARNTLVLGQPIAVELADELRLMARLLPAMRRQVETVV